MSRTRGGVPYELGSDTSREAAESMEGTSHTVEEQVLFAIRTCGSEGATCDQVEAMLEGRHQTISPRIRDLSKLGMIYSNGDKRRTRSGRMARIWRGRGY